MRGSLRADALGMTETDKGVKNRHNFGYDLCAACGGEQRIGTAAAKESPRSSHSEKPKAAEGGGFPLGATAKAAMGRLEVRRCVTGGGRVKKHDKIQKFFSNSIDKPKNVCYTTFVSVIDNVNKSAKVSREKVC